MIWEDRWQSAYFFSILVLSKRKWDCDEWKVGNSERSDTPERPLEIRGERKVPPFTMNATQGRRYGRTHYRGIDKGPWGEFNDNRIDSIFILRPDKFRCHEYLVGADGNDKRMRKLQGL